RTCGVTALRSPSAGVAKPARPALAGLPAAALGGMLALSAGALAAQPHSSGPSSLPVLTTASQGLRLTSEQASTGYPVLLRAVVTYYDGDQGELFVRDSTAGIYIEVKPPGGLPGKDLGLAPGDRLEIEGRTSAGEYAPDVGSPQLAVIGHGTLPRP